MAYKQFTEDHDLDSSLIEASDLNLISDAIEEAIKDKGLALDSSDTKQLAKAINIMKANSITGIAIADDAIEKRHIKNNSVDLFKLDVAVTNAIATNTQNIADNKQAIDTMTHDNIPNDTITTDMLKDAIVTLAKLANKSVNLDKLSDDVKAKFQDITTNTTKINELDTFASDAGDSFNIEYIVHDSFVPVGITNDYIINDYTSGANPDEEYGLFRYIINDLIQKVNDLKIYNNNPIYFLAGTHDDNVLFEKFFYDFMSDNTNDFYIANLKKDDVIRVAFEKTGADEWTFYLGKSYQLQDGSEGTEWLKDTYVPSTANFAKNVTPLNDPSKFKIMNHKIGLSNKVIFIVNNTITEKTL